MNNILILLHNVESLWTANTVSALQITPFRQHNWFQRSRFSFISILTPKLNLLLLPETTAKGSTSDSERRFPIGSGTFVRRSSRKAWRKKNCVPVRWFFRSENRRGLIGNCSEELKTGVLRGWTNRTLRGILGPFFRFENFTAWNYRCTRVPLSVKQDKAEMHNFKFLTMQNKHNYRKLHRPCGFVWRNGPDVGPTFRISSWWASS